ncbi:MAG: molybdopterin-binding protein [Cytophagales bacterium]|nr:molybdopterin-binding protein [Cytophagales bacterium]
MLNQLTPPPCFGLIIIGDEILSGKRADKHLEKVIEILASRGLPLSYANYVGDDPVRITAALKTAFESGDVVFSTGGIGATPDDHTRQCAAKALGRDLVLHPRGAELIDERMRDIAKENGTPYEPNRSDNQHRLNMAMFPAGADLIPNPYNKIAGFSIASDKAVGAGAGAVYFVPGFPVMAWPMIEWVLETHYSAYFNQLAYAEQSVIVQGSMEATLTPLMEQIERDFAGIKVFSLPSVDHPKYGRHIELGVKGEPALVKAAYPALISGLRALHTVVLNELKR